MAKAKTPEEKKAAAEAKAKAAAEKKAEAEAKKKAKEEAKAKEKAEKETAKAAKAAEKADEPKSEPEPEPAPEPPKKKKVEFRAPKGLSGKSVIPEALGDEQPDSKVTRDYWCGLMADCPVANIGLGGQSFPVLTEVLTTVNKKTARAPQRGVVLSLTEKQVEGVLKSLSTKVVRTLREGAAGAIHDTTTRGYYKDPNDRALAEFVYMIDMEDIAESGDPMWRENEPISLAEMEAAAR